MLYGKSAVIGLAALDDDYSRARAHGADSEQSRPQIEVGIIAGLDTVEAGCRAPSAEVACGGTVLRVNGESVVAVVVVILAQEVEERLVERHDEVAIVIRRGVVDIGELAPVNVYMTVEILGGVVDDEAHGVAPVVHGVLSADNGGGEADGDAGAGGVDHAADAAARGHNIVAVELAEDGGSVVVVRRVVSIGGDADTVRGVTGERPRDALVAAGNILAVLVKNSGSEVIDVALTKGDGIRREIDFVSRRLSDCDGAGGRNAAVVCCCCGYDCCADLLCSDGDLGAVIGIISHGCNIGVAG